MMKKLVKVSAVLFLWIGIFSCDTKRSEYEKIMGQEYYSLREFKPFINFQEMGGSVIIKNDSTSFALNQYESGTVEIIAFERITDESHRRVKYSLLDILEIPGLKKDEYLAYGICRLNGKWDPEILAIYEPSNGDVEYFTKIRKAWRANTNTLKMEEISCKGIDCENEVYGEE